MGGSAGHHPLTYSPVNYWDFSDATMLFTDTGRTTPVASDGDIVKGVTDQGSLAYHLSEATNGPAYRPTTFGFKCLEWDGSNDKLGNATSRARFPNNASTIVTFAVVRAQTFGAESGGYDPGDAIMHRGLYLVGSSTTTVNPNFQSHNSTTGGAIIARKLCAADTWTIITAIQTGDGDADPNWTGTANAGVNDTRTASLASATANGNFTNGSTATGIGSTAAGSVFFDGYIAEIAHYESALTEGQRMQVERYLANKYGITLPY